MQYREKGGKLQNQERRSSHPGGKRLALDRKDRTEDKNVDGHR